MIICGVSVVGVSVSVPLGAAEEAAVSSGFSLLLGSLLGSLLGLETRADMVAGTGSFTTTSGSSVVEGVGCCCCCCCCSLCCYCSCSNAFPCNRGVSSFFRLRYDEIVAVEL